MAILPTAKVTTLRFLRMLFPTAGNLVSKPTGRLSWNAAVVSVQRVQSPVAANTDPGMALLANFGKNFPAPSALLTLGGREYHADAADLRHLERLCGGRII